jgi:hypothetical protein
MSIDPVVKSADVNRLFVGFVGQFKIICSVPVRFYNRLFKSNSDLPDIYKIFQYCYCIKYYQNILPAGSSRVSTIIKHSTQNNLLI